MVLQWHYVDHILKLKQFQECFHPENDLVSVVQARCRAQDTASLLGLSLDVFVCLWTSMDGKLHPLPNRFGS